MMVADRMALYDNNAQPKLVPSVTEDDEDDVDAVPYPYHNHLAKQVRSSSNKDRQAVAYLLRYETMVRQQEAETMATLSHLRPCIERIEVLAGIDKTEWSEDQGLDLLLQQVSYDQLTMAYQKLEKSKQYDATPEHMTTDRQLMMVLRKLTENVDSHNRFVKITWMEFVQAYQLCITGLEALQRLPAACEAGSGARNRSRNRTLSLLSLFEAKTTLLFDGAPLSVSADDVKPKSDATIENSPRNSSKSSAKKGTCSIVFSALLLILAATLGSTVYLAVVTETEMSSFLHSIENVAKDVKEQAHAYAIDNLFSLAQKRSDVEYFLPTIQGETEKAGLSVNARRQQIGQKVEFADNETKQAHSSLELYKTSPVVRTNSAQSHRAAGSAVLGSIIGAVGAPYVSLMLHKVMSILIATSTVQIILATFVAALVPMAVGGFFGRLSSYVRNNEFEFSIE